MNYYYRFPGDYSKDTQDLSLAEHGAYTLLLDYLYATEQVLPKNPVGLFRVTRAFTQDEQEAVIRVIERFFVETDQGYTNERFEKEREKARARIDAARANGSKGGRRKKEPEQQPSGNPLGFNSQTQEEPSGLPDGLPSGQALQTPNILKRINNKNTPPASKTGYEYPTEFEDLWVLYPRRPNRNKLAAFNAYKARIKQGIPHDTIMQGVIRYANFCRVQNIEPRYTLACETFLGPEHHYMADYDIESPPTTENKTHQSKVEHQANWLAMATTGGSNYVQDRQQQIIDITPAGEYDD